MTTDVDRPRTRARPPALGYAIAELPRALFELVCLLPGHLMLKRAPRGDGHPVITLPGYRSDDSAMLALRRYLRRWGYAPYPLGPRRQPRYRLPAYRLREAYAREARGRR